MLPRTKAEIDEQLADAADSLDTGTNWPGMTYEEGVHAALTWVTGQSTTPPMED